MAEYRPADKVFDLPLASGVKIYLDNQFGSGMRRSP